MTSIDEDLREQITRDRQLANLRAAGIPTDAAVQRRRLQIGCMAATVAFGMLVATFVAEKIIDLQSKSWIDPNATRLALLGFTALIGIYCFDADRHLKRVETHRARLSHLDGEIASSLLSAGLVLDAVTSLHSTLELDELLPGIVEQARHLIGADHGVLFLAEERQPMQPVVDPGSLAAVARPVVDAVIAARSVQGVARNGTVDVGVPIEADGELLAVLVLLEIATGALNEHTTALLARFGAAGGSALLNARRYEATMFLLDVAR